MSFTDWLNSQIGDFEVTIKALFSLAVIVILAFQILKSGFSIGRLLMVALTAAAVIWLVQLDGLLVIARLLSAQFS